MCFARKSHVFAAAADVVDSTFVAAAEAEEEKRRAAFVYLTSCFFVAFSLLESVC